MRDELKHIESKSSRLQGVIWISGYSAAGKTTVGRRVEALLRAEGYYTIFLDGDHLRSILGRKGGSYERAARVELSHSYLRLCSHIASQGCIVVLSAVGLYDEVSQWFHRNIPRSLQIFLEVPESERRRRDAETKRIYKPDTDFSSIYDMPELIDKRINNFNVEPSETARKIVDHYLNQHEARADFGRAQFWDNYYRNGQAPEEPSDFAKWVDHRIVEPTRLLEIGCGIGTDAAFFARSSHRVRALDSSEEAIGIARNGNEKVDFGVSNFFDEDSCELRYDCIYCRFLFDCVPLDEEQAILRRAFDSLTPGGSLFVQTRSINDMASRRGTVISPTERIQDRYIRFALLPELERRAKDAGFSVSYIAEESFSLPDERNPLAVRLHAVKPQ